MAMKFEKTGDSTYLLDVCGYVCPHPQIYTKKSLEKIAEGDELQIVQMCDQVGHDILERKSEGGKIYLKLKKG
jgi:tRNA 2-thiouridine synthesizing protein A